VKPSNAEIRRQMGMDMPTDPRDMASETYTITRKSNVGPEKKRPNYMIVAGVVLVEEDNVWRAATAEEIEELTGV
jgi:hypothetical protein